MIRYFLKRTSCTIISVILALALAFLSVVVLFIVFFSDSAFLQERIDNNKAEIIADIDSEVASLSKLTGLDDAAFVGAVNEDNFDVISSTVTKNIEFCYKTDFAEDRDLYNVYCSTVADPAKNGGKTLKRNEVNKHASLAVITACYALNNHSTANVPLFRALQGNTFIILLVSAIVVVGASGISIEVINKGRHRKYSYYGMAITTAGYILVAGTLFVQKLGFIDKHVFITYAPYNRAVRECVSFVVGKNIYVGAIMIIVGLIMLMVNYNYFRKKNIKAQREKEFNKRVVTDFLEYDEPTVSHRLDNGEGFEKEVTKIDFE